MLPVAISPARTPVSDATADGRVPFVGRRDLVRAAVLRIEAGRGTVLSGPFGIGRTRTLAAIADTAERTGRRVGRLIATRSTATVPLGAFLGLLPPETLAATRRRADSLDLDLDLDLALAVRAAVLDLGLDVLTVDDAELLDDASAALVLDLARAGVVPAWVVGPVDDAPDALKALTELARADAVEVPPFNPEESAAFAEALLQEPLDRGSALALHMASDGAPLALRELVEHHLRTSGFRRSGELLHLGEDVRAPAAAADRVQLALTELDDATRRWVELVAIAEQVPADASAALADDEAADRAETAGWVRLDDRAREYRIARPLDRDPIVTGVGARARRRALTTLVETVNALPRPLTDVERVSAGRWRLELGDALDRDEALELAASTPPAEPALAERFFRAAAVGGDADALAALAQHLIVGGGLEEAEALLLRAEFAGGAEVRVAALLGLVGLATRRSGEALAEVETALESHPEAVDLLAVQVGLLIAEARSADAVRVAETIAAADAAGPGVVLGEVYGALALAVRGDRAGAARMSADLRPIAEESVRTLPEGPMLQAWLEAAVPWATTRDPEAATAIAQRGYDRTLRDGLRPDRARFAHLLAAGRLMQGDAAQAVRLLREAESVSCFWRDSHRPEIVADLVQALVLTGEQQGAERALERLEGMRRTPEQDGAHDLAVAAVQMGRGELDDAALTALVAGDRAADRGERSSAADAWTAALRYGSRDAAERLVVQDGPAGTVRDLVRGHAQAVLDQDAGALDAVADGYWLAGVRLLALESAATAAQWRTRTSATRASAAATERLLRWAVTTPGLADPLVAGLTLAGLTSREEEVARMAATGLPDRDIAAELGISVRTAQTHLGRAFNKLGVHRRQELTGLLASS